MKDPGLVEYVVIAAPCKKNKKTVALKNLEKQEAAYYIVWIETVRFLFNMKSHKLIYPGKLVWWITLFGAMLWIASGLVLSLRPAGDPPHTFRTSSDLVPLLALGLILVGVPFGFRMLTYEKEGGRLFKTVCRAVVISSLLYAFGVLIRNLFFNATGWEPFMPFGFLAFIISWAFLGVLSLKKGFLSRFNSVLIIASALSLLSFNDQYNPYGAVVFGLLMFFVSLSMQHHSPPGKPKFA